MDIKDVTMIEPKKLSDVSKTLSMNVNKMSSEEYRNRW